MAGAIVHTISTKLPCIKYLCEISDFDLLNLFIIHNITQDIATIIKVK